MMSKPRLWRLLGVGFWGASGENGFVGSDRGASENSVPLHNARQCSTMSHKECLFRGHLRAVGSNSPGGHSPCSHTENIWLRTKRYNASGKVVSGTGGVCYLYFPAHLSAARKRALASVGVR
jgi:hypothetical protein